MKIEALNCPNCGAGVMSDSAQCRFCSTRLKTVGCPKCLGLMFAGSAHCSHCGAATVTAATPETENAGDCPRCKRRLGVLEVGGISMHECTKCGGLWSATETFESICADGEKQSAVLAYAGAISASLDHASPLSYIPCPDCGHLMNRSNFARSSGVIIDMCRQHGVWFDAEELPKIIAFIRKGGLERSREREKLEIREQRDRLRDEARRSAAMERRFDPDFRREKKSTFGSVISYLFDI